MSAHLTGSLPEALCNFFDMTDQVKVAVNSSQDPGLSVLEFLETKGIIKSSEVGSLREPLAEFKLVQAVATLDEYVAILNEKSGQTLQLVGPSPKG